MRGDAWKLRLKRKSKAGSDSAHDQSSACNVRSSGRMVQPASDFYFPRRSNAYHSKLVAKLQRPADVVRDRLREAVPRSEGNRQRRRIVTVSSLRSGQLRVDRRSGSGCGRWSERATPERSPLWDSAL